MGQLGGAARRVPVDAMAYAQREVEFVMNVHGRWESPADDQKCIAWSRSLTADTAKHATGGVYLNFMTADEGDRLHAAYGPNFERLAMLKAKYDPANLFRLSHNIQPVVA
jgi:hypothetical protein